jgi:hypothetical protein
MPANCDRVAGGNPLVDADDESKPPDPVIGCQPCVPRLLEEGRPSDDARLFEAGRSAGFAWASDEARRGYLHPLPLEPGQPTRFLIEHAQAAFGGACVGERHAFVRGFVHGVSEFWRTRITS